LQDWGYIMATVSSYDWSSWDKQSIIEMVEMTRDRIVNQPLTIDRFHNILSKHIKKYMPIRSRKSQELQVEPTYCWVGGVYHTEYDMNREKAIELCFAYSLADTKLTYTGRRFTRLCSRIADVLLHEIIHMRQARKRKFKSLPGYSSTAESTKQRQEQEYLGDNDEIDAYAFNMACELNEKFKGDMKRIVNYLNEEQKSKKRIYDTWRTYLKAFNWDQNHRITRKIKKRAIYYLSRTQVSKPFHSKDWIHR
jgi:hypothetical protein